MRRVLLLPELDLNGFRLVAALSEEVKLYIVQALACFDPPCEVIDDVQVEFGVALGRSQVTCYDPTTKQGADLGKKLKAVFETTRAKFLEEMAGNAAATKAVRVRRLERLSIKHRKNPALVAALLEQIAKEMGNVYTNKRQTEMTGADGGPIEHSAVHQEAWPGARPEA
jgi:hypothetical protein